MNCTSRNKRLSRKTARMIDGIVMCSACMFAPALRDARRREQGATRDSGSGRHGGDNLLAPGEAPQSGGEAASPIPSER